MAKFKKIYAQESELMHDRQKGAQVGEIVNPNKKTGFKREAVLAKKQEVKATIVENKKQSVDSKKNYVISAAAELEDLKQLLSKSHSKEEPGTKRDQNFANKQAVIEQAAALMKEYSKHRREVLGLNPTQNLSKEQEKKREIDAKAKLQEVKVNKDKGLDLSDLDDIMGDKILPQIRVRSNVEIQGKMNFKPDGNLPTVKSKNSLGFQKS